MELLWRLLSTDAKSGRSGENTYVSEEHALRAASDALKDIWKSDISLLTPDGVVLSEQQLKALLSARNL